MAWCLVPSPSKKLFEAVDGTPTAKHRVEKEAKLEVSIGSQPLEIEGHCERGDRRIVGVTRDGEHKEPMAH